MVNDLNNKDVKQMEEHEPDEPKSNWKWEGSVSLWASSKSD
jgi:hypothetical protein